MKFLKSHFVFKKSERNGIFVLIVLIIVIQIAYFLYPFQKNQVERTAVSDLVAFQHSLDSIKRLQQQKKDTIYPFNPNFLTDFNGYRLGLPVVAIDRLHDYRKKGKWINSAQDFQRITKISDSLLQRLAPYFKFPEWTQQKALKNVNSKSIKSDINLASILELQKISGIGEKLASRIVRYRNKLGGFRSVLQLQDVYGLKFQTRQRLLAKFKVVQTNFQKQDLNTVSLINLAENPYINYELARAIITYRQLHEGIQSFEELSKIDSFPTSKIPVISLYFYLE